MISQTANYALLAVAVLAQSSTPTLVARLSADTGVPQAYLAKILRTLGRRGFVRAKRGIRGGVALARKPADITLLEIVREFDEGPRRQLSAIPGGAKASDLHPLHKRLDQIAFFVERSLGSTTIADVLSDSAKYSDMFKIDTSSE